MQIEELVEAAARRMAVVDGQNPDKLSHNSFEWWRHYVPMARAALQAALSAAEPETNNAGSECEPLEKGCKFDPNDDPKTENIEAAPPAPSVAVEDLIADVHGAIDEYRKGMKGIEFGPNEWPTVDGVKTVIAQCLRRSALSAQVQDVAGWQRLDDAFSNFINGYGDPYEPKEAHEAETARSLKELYDAFQAYRAAAPAKQEGGTNE